MYVNLALAVKVGRTRGWMNSVHYNMKISILTTKGNWKQIQMKNAFD